MTIRRTAAASIVCSFVALAGCPQGGDLGDGVDEGNSPGRGDKPNSSAGGNVNPGTGSNGNDGNVNPGAGGNDTPASTVPAELTGQWRTILTYVPAYYTWIIDPGDFAGSIGATYYFGADGQYRYDLNTAATYFGGMCFRSTSWTEWGTLSVAGSQIALNATRATNVASDTCGEWVLDDNAPTTDSTLGFAVEQDAAGWPMLRLRFPSGEEVVLERCRDCE